MVSSSAQRVCRWATQTGQDFTADTQAKGVDFGGIHVWPDNWEMCAPLMRLPPCAPPPRDRSGSSAADATIACIWAWA